MSTEKLTRLKHLSALANRTKVELDALNVKIQDIVTVGGQPNVIEEIQINGVKQEVTNKIVNLLLATKVSELTNDSNFQNADQVSAAVQAGIAASGHAHFEKVDAVPAVADAQENVLYLVMNTTTGHYDIYAKVGESVELLDDTTVDLSAYSTTEQVNGLISDAVEALSIGDYAKAADLTGALNRIAGVEGKLAGIDTTVVAYVTAAIDALKIGDYAKASVVTELAAQVAEIKADYLKAADKEALQNSINGVDAKFANYSTTEQMSAAIKVVDDKFAGYSTTEQMNAAIKVVDDKFAGYTDTVGMNAAIKVVDDKFANYTNTAGMNAAIKVVDDKFANYYTSAQVDGMIATDAEVTAALDAVFGAQA